MDLKDQTCTREQGARLVALGVKPLATFYHMPAKDGPHGEYIQYGWHGDNLAPAFTVAELGDILPHPTCLAEMGGFVHMSECDLTAPDGKPWYCMWAYERDKDGSFGKEIIDGATEAQARAAMVIYLLEHNLMQLPEHWKEDPANACHGGTCTRNYSPDMNEIQSLPMPSYHEREMPVFNAVWKVLKGCTISMPRYFTGYQNINGCHVKLIADAIEGKYDHNTLPGA